MTIKSKNLKTKLATGSLLVALSGFVPVPMVNQALADTDTIQASGTFTDGITMSAGTNLDFDKIVATDTGGKAIVSTGNGTSCSKCFFVGTQKAGTFMFNAGSSKAIDISFNQGHKTGFVLTGAGATGVVTLDDYQLGGPVAKTTFTAGAPTQTAVAMVNKTADIKIGAEVSWGAAPLPLGRFDQNVKLVVNF